MKKIILFSSLLVLLMNSGCDTNNVNQSNFREYEFYDQYIIKIPDNVIRQDEEFWQSPESANTLKSIKIVIQPINDDDLENSIKQLAELDKREIWSNKELIRNEPFSNENGMSGIMSFYKKDNSNGIYPMYTYYVYAIINDDENKNQIKIVSISLSKELFSEIKNTIFSIQKTNRSKQDKKPLIEIEEAKKEGYQIFEQENFVLQCPVILRKNTNYIEVLKSQGQEYENVSAYIGIENEDSFDKGVIYNININDLSENMANLAPAQYSSFEETFLGQYSNNLKSGNIEYKMDTLKNMNCIYYSFSQNGLPTKAVIFIHDKKSFLLQVATRDELDKKYSNLINSFNFIK